MPKRRRSRARSVGRVAKFAQARRREIIGFSLLGFALLLFLCLISYDRYDTGLYTSDPNPISNNVVGIVGAYLAEGLIFPFGVMAFVLPVALAWWAWRVFFGEAHNEPWIKVSGLLLLMISLTAVAGVYDLSWHGQVFRAGGLVGYYLDSRAQLWFGPIGSRVLSVTLAFIGFLLTTDLLLFSMLLRATEAAKGFGRWLWRVTRSNAPGAWQWTTAHVGAWQRRAQRLATRRMSGKRPAGMLLNRVNTGPLGVTTGPTDLRSRSRGPIPISGLPDGSGRSGPGGSAAVDLSQVETDPSGRTRRGVEALARAMGVGAGSRAAVPPALEEESVPARPEEPQAPAAHRLSTASGRVLLERGDPQQLEFVPAAASPKTPRAPRRRARTQSFLLPPLDLFTASTVSPAAPSRQQVELLAARLEHALQTFGIEAEVLNVVRGPTVTRFELRLAPGIKVSRVHALGDDLALAMEVLRVRIEAPIPGRAAIGIEVPNEHRDEVWLRDVLATPKFKQTTSPLPLALGKDIAGEPVVIDLAAMPHLLIAGATGAGKTVCVNALVASLLYRCPPTDVRLLLIDPKMVELSQYNGIPNLLWPVVTDAKDAGKYLQWLVREMEERYARLARARTRNIAAYNALVAENLKNGVVSPEDPDEDDGHMPTERLPYIVTVIDELADLMMVSAKEVEDSIARLAQLARAVGIHLVLATQRPSVDVLTGVIKANFPARISFAVRSKVDSRTILDGAGAERLIGRGDLLYLPAGHARPLRVQGALVSDDEINALVKHLSAQGEPDYLDASVDLEPSAGPNGQADYVDDDLFPEAVRLVLTSGQASISMLQRRLRVGYARAARLIDVMELQGIVGQGEGSKPRELLVGLEFLERLDDPMYQ